MARIGITFEQVAAVADALAGEGQQPSIRAVRERLGDTGSPNTIHRHLAAWREARPAAAAAAPELPQALAAAIALEIVQSASRARAEIESRLVQSQLEAAELAAAGEISEAARDELVEQVAVLTTERDTLAGKTTQQSAELADSHRRIEREQQAAEAARIELSTAKLKIESQAERVSEQAAHAARLAAQQASDLERLRAELAEAQQARIDAEQKAAVLAARLEASLNQVEQVKQQAAAAAQEIRQAQAERDEARKVAAEARERAARLDGQMDAVQSQVERLEVAAAKAAPAATQVARSSIKNSTGSA